MKSSSGSLLAPPHPLLEADDDGLIGDSFPERRIRLTPTGHDVLGGRQRWTDLRPVDRWFGGTRLWPDSLWRWDSEKKSMGSEEATTPTTEQLIAALSSLESCDAAVEKLWDMGDLAFSPLSRAVLDSSLSSRARACCAELIGNLVPVGVEWLLEVLSSPNDEAADFAAWGLRWNKDPHRIETALFDLVSSSHARVRLNAARALQFIYIDLQGWDPAVLRLAGDPDERVRVAALELLVELAEVDTLLGRLSVEEVASILELAAKDPCQEARNLGVELGLVLGRVDLETEEEPPQD